MFKTGDTVWVINGWTKYQEECIVQGVITHGYRLKSRKTHAAFDNPADRTYASEAEAVGVIKAECDALYKEYSDMIHNVNDLVKFCMSHTVAPCEEYTDWVAREVAKAKAIEYGIEIID